MTIFIPYLHKNITKNEIFHVIEEDYNIGIIDRIDILNKYDNNNNIIYKTAYIYLTFNTDNLVTNNIIDTFKAQNTYHLHVTKYSDYEDRHETIWSLIESPIQNNSVAPPNSAT